MLVSEGKSEKIQENKRLFMFLEHIKNNARTNQRKMAKAVGISLGNINAMVQDAVGKKLIRVESVENNGRIKCSYKITPKGNKAMLKAVSGYFYGMVDTVNMYTEEIKRIKELYANDIAKNLK